MVQAPFVEADYLSGRLLASLSRSYPWEPLLEATDTDPNLGDDGESKGALMIQGLSVTAWARFRWNGADADGGSGPLVLHPPIQENRDFLVLATTNDYANRVGIGQAFNANDVSNSYIFVAQFRGIDPFGAMFVRTGVNGNLTGPNIVDQDGDALSVVLQYEADPDALRAFLGTEAVV